MYIFNHTETNTSFKGINLFKKTHSVLLKNDLKIDRNLLPENFSSRILNGHSAGSDTIESTASKILKLKTEKYWQMHPETKGTLLSKEVIEQVELSPEELAKADIELDDVENFASFIKSASKAIWDFGKSILDID